LKHDLPSAQLRKTPKSSDLSTTWHPDLDSNQGLAD